MLETQTDRVEWRGTAAHRVRHRINVVTADNQPIVLEGLRNIVASQPDMDIVGEALSVAELLRLVRERNVDVAVVEVMIARIFPVQLIRNMKSEVPSIKILVLSSLPEDFIATRLFLAGVNGYLGKHCDLNQIPTAIRRLASGGRYASDNCLESLMAVVQNPGSALPHHLLSDREFQVFQMICRGQSTKGIADELSLSVKTVSTHKARILEKMKMTNIAELLRYAFSHEYMDGLLDLTSLHRAEG
ncbi:MAG TPA: response regulator transcription factor [Bacteroidota bacterium]|nr:response regulator transcription factor [Bacteroidota bacterium]